MTWRQDRETLRRLAKQPQKQAIIRTMTYVLISHMRGKLHMNSFQKYHGGWKLGYLKFSEPLVTPSEYYRAYGEGHAALFFGASCIANLEDQAHWAAWVLRSGDWGELREIAERVLAGKWEAEPVRKMA